MSSYKFGSMKIAQSKLQTVKKSDLKLLQQSDNRGISQDLSQDQIKKLVPEQLKRQIFSLRLNDGAYCHDYDLVGQFIVMASSTGHVALFRLKDFELIAERKYQENIKFIRFLTNMNVIALAMGRRITIMDNNLLTLHNLDYGTSSHLEFLMNHQILVSQHDQSICYTDITNGKLIKQIKTQHKIAKIRQNPKNAIIFASFVNMSLISAYSPNYDQQLYTFDIKNKIIDFCIYEGYLIIITQFYIKIFDSDKKQFCGELISIRSNYQLHQCQVSQNGVLCIQDQSKLLFVDMKTIIKQFIKNQNINSLNLVQFNCTQYSDLIITEQNKQQHYNLDKLIIQTYKETTTIKNCLRFRPYFDNLGISFMNFQHILVPGSGLAEIDSYTANIYASTRQVNEKEVKDQLYKLNYELIGNEYLTEKEKQSNEDIVSQRYARAYDQMSGRYDTDQFKSLKAKKNRIMQQHRMKKEIHQMAEQITKKQQQNLNTKKEDNKQLLSNEKEDYLQKVKKIGKK